VWRRILAVHRMSRAWAGIRGRGIRRRDAPCHIPAEGIDISTAEVPEKQPTEHAPKPEELEKRPPGHVRETVVVIVLSVTAVLAAWCGFESAKWGGEMSIAFSQASSSRIEAARQDGIADCHRDGGALFHTDRELPRKLTSTPAGGP
jgi:hypothetical protein